MRPLIAVLGVLGLGVLGLAACQQETSSSADLPASAERAATKTDTGHATPAESKIVAAVANTRRSEADRARDGNRLPAQVLEFFGIAPGMTVLDMFSGGGYYSEILAYVVGAEGTVVAHYNSPYVAFAGKEMEARYGTDRLPNVERLKAENNELELPAERFDAVLMVLSFHDLYYVDEANGWPAIDREKLLAELYAGLRPGAVVGIVDHAAPPGSPTETGGTTHRIDPQIIQDTMSAAGFTLDGESETLRNLADDYTKIVFDEAVRGKTDRVILRFRKPGTD